MPKTATASPTIYRLGHCSLNVARLTTNGKADSYCTACRRAISLRKHMFVLSQRSGKYPGGLCTECFGLSDHALRLLLMTTMMNLRASFDACIAKYLLKHCDEEGLVYMGCGRSIALELATICSLISYGFGVTRSDAQFYAASPLRGKKLKARKAKR